MKLRRPIHPLLSLLFTGLVLHGSIASAQLMTLPQASPSAKVTQTVGISEISVSYSRPSVDGRKIWGELVPYGMSNLGWIGDNDAPWRAGANQNTIISFQHDVQVEGKALPAGDYGLHLAVNKDDSVIVILSSNASSWGSYFYDDEEDALRVETKAIDAPHQEQLEYVFSDITKNEATLSLNWERKSIPIRLSVDTDAIVLASLKNEMRNAHGFRYQNVMDAANYLLANELELELALEWAEIAISRPYVGRRNVETLELKARILEKLGRDREADQTRAEIAELEKRLAIGS